MDKVFFMNRFFFDVKYYTKNALKRALGYIPEIQETHNRTIHVSTLCLCINVLLSVTIRNVNDL